MKIWCCRNKYNSIPEKATDLSERSSNGVLILGWTILLFAGLAHAGRYLVLKYASLHLSLGWAKFWFYSSISGFVLHNILCLIGPFKNLTCADFSKTISNWQTHIAWILVLIWEPLIIIAFVQLPAGDAMAINICSGPVAAVLSEILLGQTIRNAEWVAVWLSVMGVFLIVRPAVFFKYFMEADDERSAMYNPTGYAFATISMFLQGVFMIIMPVVKQQSGPLTLAGITNFGSAVAGLTGILVDSILHGLDLPSWSDWILILSFATMVNMCRWGWMFVSDLVPVSHQSIILSFDKVWAYGAGVLIFKEPLHLLSIIGAAEVWIALIIMALYGQNESKESQLEEKPIQKNDESPLESPL